MSDLTEQQATVMAALADGEWHPDEELAATCGTTVSGVTLTLTHLREMTLAYRRRRQDVGPDVYEWRKRP
jgi:hypothetical protein